MARFRTCLVTQLSSRDLITGLLDSKAQSTNHHAALSSSDHMRGCREGSRGGGMVSGLVVLHLLLQCPHRNPERHVFQVRVCGHPSEGIMIYWTSADYSGPGKKIQISLFSPTIGKYLISAINLKAATYKTCHWLSA